MMTDTNATEMTDDMRFCLSFLEFLAEDKTNPDAVRALRGAHYMSMALDGLSNMLRALPEATQKQMAQDMYTMAREAAGGSMH